MLFYKNFIGVYDTYEGGYVGYITDISDVIQFSGYSFQGLMNDFRNVCDEYLGCKKVVKVDINGDIFCYIIVFRCNYLL